MFDSVVRMILAPGRNAGLLVMPFIFLLICQSHGYASGANDQYTSWVAEFKTAEKGPFKWIRWFCRDGTVLPPGENACAGHGGGIQHGTWNDKALRLREEGYFIANVLADVDTTMLVDREAGGQLFAQLLLERYLVAADDGWIFRGARYYRGALQVEDELAGARRLLVAAARARHDQGRDFVLLRTAAKLLAHNPENADVIRVRNLSSRLGEQDVGFEKLRNKIHSQPDADDARRVREYLQQAPQHLHEDYQQLASAIDAVFEANMLDERLAAVAQSLPSRLAADELRKVRASFRNAPDAVVRLQNAARSLRLLREQLPSLVSAAQWLDVLDASLALEQQAFTAAAELRESLPGKTRQQRLYYLDQLAMVLYGTGELSLRQWRSVQDILFRLEGERTDLAQYRIHLAYLSRVSQWVQRWYQFHFSLAIDKLSGIEPLTGRFIADQLRGGPVLHFSAVLDGLVVDANRLAGVSHDIFGVTAGGAVRMLNPGMARGVLRLADTSTDAGDLGQDGIYILPETTAELPPVAGIMTLGEGNALSHVQILARNLGIPNVVIDQDLLPVLQPYIGKPVVMAVSQGGRVLLSPDGPRWQAIFDAADVSGQERLPVDLARLDLAFRDFITLDGLRAADAGRIAGPKAANLGELRHHYPEHVPQGIVIPFGAFHAMLQQPMHNPQQTVFDWMQARYDKLATLHGDAYTKFRDVTLAELRDWLIQGDPGEAFRAQLKAVLQREFGSDPELTLFVRSDTNMEDLPGFTGAGLNLTVANVKGFEALVDAIKRVWASPFATRAFAWRQQRMSQPEHVYVSVLIMPTISVDKSGVMVTTDVSQHQPGWVSIAVNEGIGGAVQGEAAEELRLHTASGMVQLLAEATAPLRRIPGESGGLRAVPVSPRQRVLTDVELEQLRHFADILPQRYLMRDEHGKPVPGDVEFGFRDGKLVLFQVRPYLGSRQAGYSSYLNELDRGMQDITGKRVRLDEVPRESP